MHRFALLSLLPAVLACTDSAASEPTTLSTVIAAPTSIAVEQPIATPTPVPAPAPSPAAGDGPVGFGQGTTGGSGSATAVTSCSELESALESGGVISISGILEGCDIMRVSSDTTIVGAGANSGLVGGGFRMKDVENIIIQNLELSNPPKGMDLIDIESSSYIWVDHCDLSAEGIVGDKDFYDGLLDAKRGSDFITISYNRFHDHWKASLIGHSDNNGSEDEGTLHVTYHHNHWSNINSRAPSVRFGTAHIFSNCYVDVPTSGVNSRMGAQVLVEENSFTNVRRAIVTNLDSDEEGFAVERNNLYVDSDTDITQVGDFEPPYSYTADAAASVCDIVNSQAGTGVIA